MVDQRLSIILANTTNLIEALICVKTDFFTHFLQLLSFGRQHIPICLLLILYQIVTLGNKVVHRTLSVAPCSGILFE